jgi:AcrR family transcriptional regulator
MSGPHSRRFDSYLEAVQTQHAPRLLMEERRRGQILLGALDVFGEKGFAPATVQDLIDESGVSRATFYRYFADREDCFAALSIAALGWLEGETRAVLDPLADWPLQVKAAAERLVGLLTEDPRVARICCVEAIFAPKQIRVRQRAGLEALAAGLRRGRAHSRWGEKLPASMEDFLVAAGVSLATRSVFRSRPPAKDLGPEIAELILIPYLGAARARNLVRKV